MITSTGTSDWTRVAPALALTLVRVSTMIALTPFFSSKSFPTRTKAVLSLLICWLIVPTIAVTTAGADQRTVSQQLSFSGLLGEIAIGAIYGVSLSFFNEILLIAGQIIGLQFSFSLVNLLDPASEIQTPLMGDLFQLMGTLVLITAGLDRVVLASMVRTFQAVPPGSFPLEAVSASAPVLMPMLSASFLAALELAAPVLAATILVEVTVALLGKLSPQLPVVSITVPLKTLMGFVILVGSLAVWPRFLEDHFSRFLDIAQKLIVERARG